MKDSDGVVWATWWTNVHTRFVPYIAWGDAGSIGGRADPGNPIYTRLAAVLTLLEPHCIEHGGDFRSYRLSRDEIEAILKG